LPVKEITKEYYLRRRQRFLSNISTTFDKSAKHFDLDPPDGYAIEIWGAGVTIGGTHDINTELAIGVWIFDGENAKASPNDTDGIIFYHHPTMPADATANVAGLDPFSKEVIFPAPILTLEDPYLVADATIGDRIDVWAWIYYRYVKVTERELLRLAKLRRD